MDLQSLSVEQLKAIAYDQVKNIDNARAIIVAVEQELQRRAQIKPDEPKQEEAEKTE